MRVYLVGDVKSVLYVEQPIMLSARRYPNIMLLITLVKSFEKEDISCYVKSLSESIKKRIHQFKNSDTKVTILKSSRNHSKTLVNYSLRILFQDELAIPP